MTNTSRAFSETERQKFRNLLRMAAESPFANERDNARAAAERMAERVGMTLEEAASGRPPPPPTAANASIWPAADRKTASFVHLTELYIRSDKERREEAMRDAFDRGLDAAERRAAAKSANRSPFRARTRGVGRNADAHARVLIQETQLPLREVATITGLDIYQVVGLKLKMRVAA